MTHAPSPPTARDVAHLKPTNPWGTFYTLLCLGMVGAGVFMTQARWWGEGHLGSAAIWTLWGAGHVVLSFGLLQAFVLLHECGHGVLFRSKRLNHVVGHMCGVLCAVPYRAWTTIHAAHHKWTGWQDLDPTTESLVPRALGRAESALMNTCWRYWIPAFSVLYRLTNFWNPGKLKRMARTRSELWAIGRNALALLLLYAGLAIVCGPLEVILAVGPGCLLSLVMLDPIMLSQHSHIPQQLSHGEPVRAVKAPDQEVYTRSLRFPAWFSRYVLLHFDAHELHHIYPQLPGYHLRHIPYTPQNEAHWWTWIRSARAMPAQTLLFQNRHDTGSEV